MRPSRREFLIGSAGIGLASALPLESASATPAMLEEAIRNVIGEANLQTGKITLEVPPLVENGNTVPVTIIVDSPMSKADHVKAIHVFNEKNPQPRVISITLGPRAGKARIATRIKLADTQRMSASPR
jgi:sulfur-oxidizing protein SoxY